MSQLKFENALDEIRSICKKHGVVLVGTCGSEGALGEITIVDARQLDASVWFELAEYVEMGEDEELGEYPPSNFSISCIG